MKNNKTLEEELSTNKDSSLQTEGIQRELKILKDNQEFLYKHFNRGMIENMIVTVVCIVIATIVILISI